MVTGEDGGEVTIATPLNLVKHQRFNGCTKMMMRRGGGGLRRTDVGVLLRGQIKTGLINQTASTCGQAAPPSVAIIPVDDRGLGGGGD